MVLELFDRIRVWVSVEPNPYHLAGKGIGMLETFKRSPEHSISLSPLCWLVPRLCVSANSTCTAQPLSLQRVQPVNPKRGLARCPWVARRSMLMP